MSQFTSDLIVKPIGHNRWELVEGFIYHIGSYPSENIIEVPPGFITDFASIPRIFWNILPPYGKYGKAAVIHDFCYATAAYEREACDIIFLEGMKVLGVSYCKRQTMYIAVSLFGWYAWNQHRKNEILK